MDYEKLWNELKEHLIGDRDCYKEGKMMSVGESIHGYTILRTIVERMDEMEQEAQDGLPKDVE